MQNYKDDPRFNLRAPELVAAYEELHNVPEEKRVTEYIVHSGAHCFDYLVDDSSILSAYEKALTAIRVGSEEFLESEDFLYWGGIAARMMDCMLTENSRLRDVAGWTSCDGYIFAVHEDQNASGVLTKDISRLTASGREDFSALLDAKVKEVRLAGDGIEIVISGVEPQELERFRDACEAHEQAEQTMGGGNIRTNFDTAFVVEGLTAYAIERQNGEERSRLFDSPDWAAQRRVWINSVLQGMNALNGQAPDAKALERFDHRLEQARNGSATIPTPPEVQQQTIHSLQEYVLALDTAGGDSRQQLFDTYELLQDVYTHRPWHSCKKEIGQVMVLADSAMKRMTAQRPIRFTYLVLSGGLPSCTGGFASGAVKDIEAVKATELYQKVTQWAPEAAGWRASSSIYVGGNANLTGRVIDADELDMRIIRKDEYSFLKQPGLRCVDSGEWDIPVYERISVLRIAPGTAPEKVVMPNTLETVQEAVGGDIETVELDANAMLVCNAFGKLMGLPANRQVGGDTIAGTFLIVGAEDGEFCSLTDADAAHYAEKFAEPMPVQEGPTTWEFHVF